MRYCFFIFLSMLTTSPLLYSQINKQGIPFYKNYTTEDYNSGEQNWAVVKDNRGVYYFGKNEEGVMEFDGIRWNTIPIKNNSTVRALCVGEDGLVYVGSVGDIGRLVPNAVGKLEYQSLKELHVTDTSVLNSFKSDVFKIYSHKGNIYFCHRQYIFKYDYNSVSVINMGNINETRNFYTFLVNGRFFVGSYLHGLSEIIDDRIVHTLNSEILAGKNTICMLPYENNNALIATDGSEFFVFDMTNNTFEPWRLQGTNTEKLMSNPDIGMLYGGISLTNGNYGFGYVGGVDCSFIEVSPEGKVLTMIGPEFGLNDVNVCALYQDSRIKNGNLWLALNNGIANYEIASPLKFFNETTGIILDIATLDDRLYVATMDGLFVETINDMGVTCFKPVNNILGLIWTLLLYTDPYSQEQILLAGTNNLGIYSIKDSTAQPITANEGYNNEYSIQTKKLYQSKQIPNRVYIGSKQLSYVEYIDGKWQYPDKMLNLNMRSVAYIAEDSKNTLWCGTEYDGIYRLNVTGNKITAKRYGEEKGISDAAGVTLLDINGEVYFGLKDGLYEYDTTTDSIVKSQVFDSISISSPYQLVEFNNEYIITSKSTGPSKIQKLTLTETGKWESSGVAFASMPSNTSDALHVNNNTLYIGASTTLYVYNTEDTKKHNRTDTTQSTFDVSFRRITIGDSVLFDGAFFENNNGKITIIPNQPAGNQPQLAYINNNILFEYSALWYKQTERTQYSYMLEGYWDKWSNWSTEHRQEFTNLDEGLYIFHVKAKNIDGSESNIASYRFKILPPFYRTIYAYILYILAAVGFIFVILKMYTRRLIEEKSRLEKIITERTSEIVKQKEEIEEQHKKILIQNEHITSSITYASQLQHAVLPLQETIDKLFPESFILYLPRDIVSGDFYWFAEKKGLKYSVVADCTGHGVPGGFMSMMGISFLNEILALEQILTAGEILCKLRDKIINALHQTGKIGENKDGMDIALYIIDPETNQAQYAGANNALVLVRNNETIVYKADRMPIGIYFDEGRTKQFETKTFELQKGDVLYTFSDGYIDQFGGPKGRRFMSRNMYNLFVEIHKKPMCEQREILHQTLLEWINDFSRIDDILIMGYRYN